MSFIDTIEIKNFKSIRHQKIEGCKRVNVFIGYPNVGKSNILEAMSLFSINRNNLNFSSNIRIEKLTTLFYNGSIENNLEIRINNNRRWVGGMFSSFIRLEEQFSKDGYSFDESSPMLLQEAKTSDLFVVGSFFELRELKKEKENESVKVAIQNFHSPNTLEIKFNQRLGQIKKYTFKKDVAHSDAKYDSLIYPHGDNLFSILSSHPSIKNQINELFERYNLELLHDSRQQSFSILKRTDSGIFSIPYDLVADTLQRLIFFKTAVLNNQGDILLFEEPEAHMFPPYISKFTADVMFDKNSNQYFIATQSPFVLNDFMEDMDKEELAIFAVGYKKETGETVVRRIMDNEITEIYQYGIDLFFNLENFLKDAV